MIIEKIIGNLNSIDVTVPVDTVEVDWFETESKRLRKVTSQGREIGIAVEEKLSDGDILYIDDTVCIAVKLSKCELLKITVSSISEMGRLCFEIGNRHLSLKITDKYVLIPYDAPTEHHLHHLGFSCEKTVDEFSDFIVCKAHGHSHHHHE